MLERHFVVSPFDADRPLFMSPTDQKIWHRLRHRVAYGDTDRGNIVYHPNYLRYFELGRTELLRDLGCPYSRIEADGYVCPVIAAEVHYQRSLHYDDAVYIYSRPLEADDRVRFSFEYVIAHADTQEVTCSGTSTHCTLGARGRAIAMESRLWALWRSFPAAEERIGA